MNMSHSGIGAHHDSVDLIGFDPARDFTIQPWLAERINRAMQPGDVILGAERDAPLGSQLLIFGKPHTVYGRLGRTGVGTHERGVFMPFATLEALAGVIHGPGGNPPAVLAPGKVTGFLVELAPGATALQARFAGTAWTECDSWYRDKDGRIVANWPGYMREYLQRTEHLDAADYRFMPMPDRAPPLLASRR